MRIAHLILAHKEPEQLARLLRALQHRSSGFFLHIDGKTDITPFLPLTDIKNVFLVRRRAKVHWAGYGTIQATLNGLAEILQGDYDYINVISGQDFPLTSPDAFHDFISSGKDREYITCESIETEWTEAAPRIKEYHLINWRIPGKYRLEKIITALFPPRKFPLDHTIVGRANWFTVSQAAARYMLDFIKANPKMVRYFKYCWGADEFIFSTILFNSPFRAFIKPNLVYVDWTGPKNGHPKILGVEDMLPMLESGKFFARKFDGNTSPAILTMLEERIAGKVPPSTPQPPARS
jgi:hypothetical protein